MNSFFPDAITSWNNVISHFDRIPSINILKNHIFSLIRPKGKNIIGIHDPFGLRYLLQLRVGLSLLRYHKKCQNFIDTPSDKCLCNHGIEDTNHFLFLCPFSATQRATLSGSVIQILHKYNLNHLGNQSHLCLYGDPFINSVDNRNIRLSTIKYIKKHDAFQRKFVILTRFPRLSSTTLVLSQLQFHYFPPKLSIFVSLCMCFVFSFFIYFIVMLKFSRLPWFWLNFYAKPCAFLF